VWSGREQEKKEIGSCSQPCIVHSSPEETFKVSNFLNLVLGYKRFTDTFSRFVNLLSSKSDCGQLKNIKDVF